jgi:polyhydroxyalkanoate synthesis regulator phasin
VDGAIRELIEQLGLAAVGAVSLTADRADRLADELSSRPGMRREDVRAVLEDAMGRWRSEAGRFGDRVGAQVAEVLAELGLVAKDQFEELELRVAQLEHRLRLLEPPLPGSNGAPPKA